MYVASEVSQQKLRNSFNFSKLLHLSLVVTFPLLLTFVWNQLQRHISSSFWGKQSFIIMWRICCSSQTSVTSICSTLEPGEPHTSVNHTQGNLGGPCLCCCCCCQWSVINRSINWEEETLGYRRFFHCWIWADGHFMDSLDKLSPNFSLEITR